MTKIGQVLVNKGKLEGMEDKLVDQITKKLAKGRSIAEIADALEETEEMNMTEDDSLPDVPFLIASVRNCAKQSLTTVKEAVTSNWGVLWKSI